jgi:hypothetical protein
LFDLNTYIYALYLHYANIQYIGYKPSIYYIKYCQFIRKYQRKRTCLCIIIKIAPIYVGKTSLHCSKKMGNKKFLGEVTTPNIITNYRGGGGAV